MPAALLQAPGVPLETVVATLINDLETAAPDLVLVLDDYHVIESAEIHESVAFLLEHLPPQIRLVIATRADPPLPLASLRADGDLLEVRAADLRFTPDETAAYLAGADGPGPHRRPTSRCSRPGPRAGSPRSSSPRCRCRAATTRRRSSPSSPATTGSSSTTSPTRSSSTRRPRSGTSCSPPRSSAASPDRCARRSPGATTPRPILEELDRSNLFLVAARRPPHLVPLPPPLRRRPAGAAPRRAARPGARAAPPGERLVRRQRRTARGHRPRPGRRRPGPGRRADRAGRARRCSGPARRRSCASWLEALPADALRRPARARHRPGRGPHGDRRPDRRRSRCSTSSTSLARPRRRPDRRRRGRVPPACPPWSRSTAPGSPCSPATPTRTISHATRVLELAGDDDPLQRGAAAALLGLAHWSRGDLDDRPRPLRRVDRAASSTAATSPDVMGCSLALADIQLAQGRLRDAQRTFEHALRHTADAPGPPGRRGHARRAERVLASSATTSTPPPSHLRRQRRARRAQRPAPAPLPLARRHAPGCTRPRATSTVPSRCSTRPMPRYAHRLLAAGPTRRRAEGTGRRPSSGDLDAADRWAGRARARGRRRPHLRPRVRAHHPRPGAPRPQAAGRRPTLDQADRLLDRLLARGRRRRPRPAAPSRSSSCWPLAHQRSRAAATQPAPRCAMPSAEPSRGLRPHLPRRRPRDRGPPALARRRREPARAARVLAADAGAPSAARGHGRPTPTS